MLKPLKQIFFSNDIPLSTISFSTFIRISARLGQTNYGFLFVIAALFFSSNFHSFAQETTKPRPKIGLVLSGGGAKAFAHIGVLKVLESAGVKIDYIGGTSMGAAVGGLYASGYNATQIDSIFKAIQFGNIIQDIIPRESKNFYEKRNDELYALSLPFDNFKIGIPTSLSKGIYNYNLLTRLTHNVRHVRDFSKLPIPFLCMATNIETGKQVLLNKGYLPQAMMASAAFPTLFSPVEIDGNILVDGGVINNYPIEELRKMGADVIIGVDVQDGLKDRTGLKDATKIMIQITNLQMIQSMNEKIASTEIYIKPDVTNFGIISFENRQEIINKGEEAAFSVYEKLKLLATEPSNFKPKLALPIIDSLRIDNFNINKLEHYTRSYVLGKLGFKSRKKISYKEIEIGVDKLSATQNFSTIKYTLDPSKDQDDLNIYLEENQTKSYLKFGLHYDILYKSAILVNYTQKKSLFKNDVLSIDAALGDNFRYNFDYYIDNGFHWSFGLKSRLNRFNRNLTTDFRNGLLLAQLGTNNLNIIYSDLTNQAYLQTVSFQKFLLAGGFEHKYLRIKSETLQNTTPIIENSNYFSCFVNLKYDSFDNKYFPKKGWNFIGDFQSYLYSSDYNQQFTQFSIAKAEAGIAKTFFNKTTFKMQSEVGFNIGEKSVPYFDFILGGYGFDKINNMKYFYGYDFLSQSADSFVKTTFTLDYEFYRKNHMNLAANYAQLGDNLFSNSEWMTKPKYNGYAVGYGLETPVGPIEVKYTWSPDTHKSFTWISVGFYF
jgi:NTE family protein